MKGKIEKRSKESITIDYENKRLSVFYFIPLLLIAGFVPLIVYAKYVDLSGTTQALYWTGQQQYLDFFSYWKSRWVIGLTAIALIFYIMLYKQKKLPLKNLKQYYIPLGIYAIFVIISTIFAIDSQTALWGFVDMYQGMFVLLSYALITFLTINFVNSERDLNLFINAFLFLMIIEGIIGVGQYFGFDIFQTKIGNDLILPNNLKVDNLSFSFGPKTIYGTLFNTNFVGSFATLMLPISVAILLAVKTSMQRVILGFTVGLMLFISIGCNSRAGYIGIAVSTLISVWIFRRIIIKHWKVIVCIILFAIILILITNSISNDAIFNRLRTFNIFSEIDKIKSINRNETKFEDIKMGENTFSIKTNKETLNFKVDGEKLYFFDEDQKNLEISNNGNKITINDPRYSKYIISIPTNYPGVTVDRGTYWDWMTLNFFFSNDGVKMIGSGGRLTKPAVAERIEAFDDVDALMSNRVYIWSRTIPILKSYLLTGSGADNFPMTFPQDDFVAKLNVGMDSSTVVDKPHNMYLQIATNTGVISLLMVIAITAIYLSSSIKIYSKLVYDSILKFIGAGCLVSVFGYMTAAIFNDQIVSVAPLFWLILGIGISINNKIISLNDIK